MTWANRVGGGMTRHTTAFGVFVPHERVHDAWYGVIKACCYWIGLQSLGPGRKGKRGEFTVRNLTSGCLCLLSYDNEILTCETRKLLSCIKFLKAYLVITEYIPWLTLRIRSAKYCLPRKSALRAIFRWPLFALFIRSDSHIKTTRQSIRSVCT